MIDFKTFLEDSGAGGMGGGGAAPTNVDAGIGSIVSPTGKVQDPPVSKKAQKKIKSLNNMIKREV